MIVANGSSLQNTSLSAEVISIRMIYLSGGLLTCISLVDYHFLKTGVSSLSVSSASCTGQSQHFPILMSLLGLALGYYPVVWLSFESTCIKP